MRVEPVDPRDVTSEVRAPAYRVIVWTGLGTCQEFELTDTDVAGAREWARTRTAAPGLTYSLWAVVPGVGSVGKVGVRLEGWDPPDHDASRPAWAVTTPA